VFGKANSSAINLSAIADASNPLGGFVIHVVGFTKHNIRFTCSRLTTWGTPGTYNQIIQTIAVDITCTGD
jgi:hypothetical protein